MKTSPLTLILSGGSLIVSLQAPAATLAHYRFEDGTAGSYVSDNAGDATVNSAGPGPDMLAYDTGTDSTNVT
ncbi:MAG: hypothetical protein ACQKBY_10080 [Verrucomicrobiales bacterium]